MVVIKNLLFVRLPLIVLIIMMLVAVKYSLPRGVRTGFSLANISSSVARNPTWAVPIADKDKSDCQAAFAQPFSYLAVGTECHVFVSQDQRYVIKFLRHNKWRLHPWLVGISLPACFDNKRQRFLKRKQGALIKTLKSCLVAYREFKPETGILCLHLAPSSDLKVDLRVVDCLGFTHAIPLDAVDFILQKKAVRTDEYLLALRRCCDHDRARKAVTALVDFSLRRAKQGYHDTDPHFVSNFGFIEHQVVQIDVGGFCRQAGKGLDYFYGSGLATIRRKFLPWVEKHYPELIDQLEKEVKRIRDQRATLVAN
ncbi:MAG: hypothetical protein AAF443_01590 [Chlamydiota bacterium]